MTEILSITEIKEKYPDEWVLLGNPVMDESQLEVFSGIPLYHSKDKKEVCYLGREKVSGYSKITLIFTGKFRPKRRTIGLFYRLYNN